LVACGAVILATIVWMALQGASAYSLLGGKWRSVTNLPYWFYTAVQANRTAFAAAVSAWNGTATPVWLIDAGTASFASIGIRSTSDASVSWDGITYLYPSQTANPYTYASVYINDWYTNDYPAGKRQSVAAHELGHALGLDHVSGAVLMNPRTCGANSRWCTYGIKSPTADEVNGINSLYSPTR
jgi:hypothetical protein